MLISIVVPPLGEPTLPNMAAELLAAIARRDGHTVHTVHGPLLAPRAFTKFITDGVTGPGIFAPFYYGDEDLETQMSLLVLAMEEDVDLANRNGSFAASVGRDAVMDQLVLAAGEVGPVVEGIADRVLAHGVPDLVAVTVPFDKDKLPTAAIAKVLRRRGFDGPLITGGTGLGTPMNVAFLEAFTEIDYVLSGEGERTWPEFCSLLAAGEDVRDLPGLCYRASGGIVSNAEDECSSLFRENPICDWTAFVEQRRGTRWDGKPLTLMVESSRGCWWGAKHQCAFCSVSMADHPYRAKEWRDVVEEFVTIYDTHHPGQIMTSDAVLPHHGLVDFLHHLYQARRTRPWKIFYEVKSTYSRRTIARMAAAGILCVQPGIESFSTPVLTSMGKGAKGIQQINFLKWATAYDMSVIYCLMCGTPGETADDVRHNERVLRLIPHYAPASVHGLYLFRGSPYQRDPERYGFTDLTAGKLPAFMYRGTDPERIVHNLLYALPEHQDPGYLAAVENLREAGEDWERRWLRGASLTRSPFGRGCSLLLQAAERGRSPALSVLDPLRTALMDAFEEPRAPGRVADRLRLDAATLDREVRALADEGLLLIADGQALTLPLPSGVCAEVDAGWSLPAPARADTQPARDPQLQGVTSC
jgi:ribosomal peptide maturation radical SAM protein 1